MRSLGPPEVTGSHYKWHILASLIITAVVAVIYSNTLDAAFHLDDFKQIIGNRSLRSLDNLFSILRSPKRGVANATFALNYAFGGLEVKGYHIVNIFIHAVNSILVYFLLFFTISAFRNMRGRAGRIAFFIAILFAAHPVQTQAVTYIIQRHESLSAFFCLLALFFFVLALNSGGRFRRPLLYAAVPICYLLAFYSKEIAVTLPALIFLFDLYFTGGAGEWAAGGWRKRWPLHVVMAILLIFFSLTIMSALGGLSGLKAGGASSIKAKAFAGLFPVVSAMAAPAEAAEVKAQKPEQLPTAGFGVEGLSPGQYFLTELNVITYYMVLLAIPVNQNIDYDFPISKSLFASPQLREGTRLIYALLPPVVSLVIILSILALALYLLMRSRENCGGNKEAQLRGTQFRGSRGRIASYFILWFFIVLSPTSSFIPIIDVIFEHRIYLASLGFFVIVVLFIDWVSFRLFGGKELQNA